MAALGRNDGVLAKASWVEFGPGHRFERRRPAPATVRKYTRYLQESEEARVYWTCILGTGWPLLLLTIREAEEEARVRAVAERRRHALQEAARLRARERAAQAERLRRRLRVKTRFNA